MNRLKDIDHIYVILVAFLATLGCYTSLALIGAEGVETLKDLLFFLVGGFGVAAIPIVRRKE